MIDKMDVYKKLFIIKNSGESIDGYLNKVIVSETPDKDVISFINEKLGLAQYSFLKDLKDKYNSKVSKVYKRILTETLSTSELTITLSSLTTQVFIYSKDMDAADKQEFYKEMYITDCLDAITSYVITGDSAKMIETRDKLKNDIMVFFY